MSTIIPTVAADFENFLDASVSEGDTTATLNSVTDTDGVALANGLYGFTIDNDTDYKEYILCTLTSTALSNIYSISDQGVATAGFANYHRRGAVVQITDHVSLLKVIQTLTGVVGIDNAVPLYYAATPSLGSSLQLATVQYVLDHVNGGAVSFNAEIVAGMAGETITSGQWVYLKTSDGRWYKTDATDKTKCFGVRVGKALGAGTAGNAIAGGVFLNGLETAGSYAAFTTYYLSDTAGALSTSAGTNSVVVGFADGNAKLIVGQTQQSYRDAMAGNSGTPSSVNTYLTQLSTSVSGTDQSQTTQNGTFSVGEADATTRHNKLAQSFTPTKTQLKGVNLYKSANTGTFTGTVTIAIQADSAGSPSGVNLVSKTVTNALYLAYSTGDFIALFSSEIAVTPGSLYWIVVSTSTSDTANCINLGTNTAGGYTGGSAKYNNTTDGWVAISTIDLYFKTIEGSSGKELVGDSSGLLAGNARKLLTKIGTLSVSTSATAVVHGLGKVPALVRGSYANASNANMAYSMGSYDVAANTYATYYVNYNEATSGTAAAGTTHLVDIGATSAEAITVSSVDENVVLFVTTSGTATIAYEIIA